MDRRTRVTKQQRAYTAEVADALNRRIELHTCRQQHTVLRHILTQFPTSLPFSGAEMMLLRERLNAVLLPHLRLEDDQLYPQLAHSDDEHVRTTARTFRMQMGGVLRAFVALDARWNNAATIDADPAAFLEHWTSVRTALETRMNAEDRGLYLHAEEYFGRILQSADND